MILFLLTVTRIPSVATPAAGEYSSPVTQSLWEDAAAARWTGDIGQRIYSSQLLGQDPDLVLHGGGNTSVKTTCTTVFGETVDALVIKGSGHSLAEIDESGFAWLALDRVARLATLPTLSDTEMVEELLTASLRSGPTPSVEAILHALLPHKYVDHTHADAIVTLSTTVNAYDVLKEAFGDTVIVVPYTMPGFKLAKACAAQFAAGLPSDVVGIVLMKHGVITFGTSAKQAYDRMIDLVTTADRYIALKRTVRTASGNTQLSPHRREALASLRFDVSALLGNPVIVKTHADLTTRLFLDHSQFPAISQKGPITPDHVIRTKALPLVGRDVPGYAAAYSAYFHRYSGRSSTPLLPLDPAPRVILDSDLGMCCIGRSPREADVVADIYSHTMRVVLDATDLGGYDPVPPADLFDVEYWELEQAKLRRQPAPLPRSGEIAVVTGAASGIGRACAGALLAEGAAVVGLDTSPDVESAFVGSAWLGIRADVTDPEAVRESLDRTARRYGGLDILVLNAGAFPPGAAIVDLDASDWHRMMALHVEANARLLREAHCLLTLAPNGGRVVVIGSKNVPAPGPGAAAYSASKAALTQLARVAALEWGDDGIRINIIHPNAVFDTGVWSPGILAERAARYRMTVEDYRSNNLLHTEIQSADVAHLCVAMCGPAFAKTTGAQVPVDGGNDRVI